MIPLLLLTAFASDDREGARLIAEIGRHAADSQWKGVDRTYKRLLEDHPGSLTGGAHLVAAQAARSQGDLLLALQRAQRVSADDELAGEATAIVERLSTTTRLVVLEASIGAELGTTVSTFDPTVRAAMDLARRQLAEHGVFVGLLPVGSYTLGERTVELSAGMDWTVVR